jgi:sigma-B regulation protein RsbU (phosphoserine phosphatase)
MADVSRPVLVADDQPDVIAALRLLLRSAGFDMHGASSVDEVRARLADGEYDAVLMDLNYARDTTSGAEGLQLIADLHAARPDVPLIAMTGWANIDTAVQAMRLGARGYVPKPWSNDALVQVLRTEIAQARADRRAGTLAAREWREAESLQRALLPSTLPDVPGCSLAARWEPASGLGGDYYDVFALGHERFALCVGDVCGKGLPAALLVSSVQATVRACAGPDTAPRDVLVRVNAALCRQGAHGRFVTLVVAVLDARARTLAFSNAGHNAPMLVRADGTLRRLETGGMIAGVFDTATYDGGTYALAAGDRVLFFTDGLIEAGLSESSEYGDDRLVDTLTRHRALDPAALVERLFVDVHAWAGRGFDDDATALVVGVNA